MITGKGLEEDFFEEGNLDGQNSGDALKMLVRGISEAEWQTYFVTTVHA